MKAFSNYLYSYDSLRSNSTWKKKSALRIINTLVFLKTLWRFFYGPLSQTIFQGNSEPLLSTSKSHNQPTRKLQLKITPISILFSTHILQNLHMSKQLHCTHTSTCTCTVNIQFWLLFFNHYLEFECLLQLAECFNAYMEMQSCISDILHWPKAAQNLCF